MLHKSFRDMPRSSSFFPSAMTMIRIRDNRFSMWGESPASTQFPTRAVHASGYLGPIALTASAHFVVRPKTAGINGSLDPAATMQHDVPAPKRNEIGLS